MLYVFVLGTIEKNSLEKFVIEVNCKDASKLYSLAIHPQINLHTMAALSVEICMKLLWSKIILNYELLCSYVNNFLYLCVIFYSYFLFVLALTSCST